MTDDAECGQSPESRALAERLLRALAVAQLRAAQHELAKLQLSRALAKSQQLISDEFILSSELRETIASVAREELAAGHSPVDLVLTLHDIVNEAELGVVVRPDIEPCVILWGIEAYFAA